MSGYWQRATAEDSAGNDIDAGRLVALAGGGAIVLNIVVFPLLAYATGTFSPIEFAGGVVALGGALATLLTGTGAYMLMKGKGEGQPQ